MMNTKPLLALMLCAACGGGSANTNIAAPVDVTGAPAEAQVSSFDFMPADTFGYAEVSVARGLSSPYYTAIREVSDAQFTPEQRSVRDRAIEFAQLVDHVYLSFGRNDSGTNVDLGIVVIEGRFTIQNAVDFATAMEPNDPPQRLRVGVFEAATIDDVTLVNVGDGRFLFGPTARCTALALNPPRSGFHSRPFFAEAETRIDAEAILRVITERPRDLPRLDREIDSELGAGTAEQLRGGAFSADAMDGAHVRGAVMTVATAPTHNIEVKLNELRQILLQAPLVSALGLRSVIEGTSITSDATSISAALDISDADLRRLVQVAVGLFGAMVP